MRKIYIVILSLFTFFFWNTKSIAQVNTYIFAQSSGAFTPITGGTVLGTATANTIAGSIDDQVFTLPAGSFPFTFTFNGIGYTGCNVNTNGYITFGATPPGTTGYTPISATTAYDGAISAWGRDINSVFAIASTTGELRWETVGTAPNRVIVFQWKSYRPAYTTSTTDAFVFDLQVRLSEGSNRIDVVYGGTLGYIIGALSFSGSAGTGPQIGLRGATNADYNSRTNPTSAAFATSTASLANANAQSFNTTANPPGMPASGLTYTWLPPPPCVPGSLAGGTTQSTVASACAAVPFTLSVTGASFGTGLTYQWESSLTGLSPWGPIGGATAITYVVPTQTVATYYRRKMTCGGIDAFSIAVQVNQNAPTACYCNTGLTTFINGIDIVTNVVVTSTSGTLTQASASNGTTNYDNYTNTPLDLPQGTNASLAMTFGTDGTQYSAAWIDYNQNGIFEASENIALAAAAAGGGATVTYNFIVPVSATLGLTRLRIRGASDGAYAAGGACTTTNYGETEDYRVNIVAPPPCLSPTGLTISAITTNTATISWTAPTPAPAGGYQWEIRTSGAGGSGATGLVTSGATGTTTTPVGGLTANTTYTLYVRSVCVTGSLFSTWFGSSPFTTPCIAASIPYTQDFESAVVPAIPICTSRETITGNPWTVQSNPGSGFTTKTLRYNYNTAQAANSWFYTQGLNLTAGTSYRVKYRYGNNSTFFTENLKVAYGNNPASAAMTVTLATHTGIVGGVPVTNQVDFIAPATGVYYIGFQSFSLADEFYLFVDDITVKLTPTCDEVTAMTALATTSTSVLVSFTSPGTAFIVEYGPTGFVPGTTNTAGVGGTVVFGPSSPITVGPPGNTLNPSTTYDFYVRRICIPGVDFSENVKATATTLCAATNVPYTQDFTGVVVPAIPACTSIQDLNGTPTWLTVTPAAAWGFPGNALRYLYDVAKPANDWFFIQGLNLTGGTTYQLSYKYGATDPLYPEKMKVAYGTAAHAGAMVNTLADYPSIVANSAAPFAKFDRVVFTPATTGVYYIGFQVYSNADEFQLFLDSINVKIAPLVDVGITGITLPAINCPTNGVFVQATVKNYNLLPENFATYPVTVTANITGAGTGTLTALINTGTLAPGASMSVYLSPAFNFSAGGTYNFTVVTSTNPASNDPETANDSYSTSVVVNPNPPTPVITPAAAAICAGTSVLLSTQFTASPPVITWTPVTGLYTNAGATTAYSGGNAFSLYAKPAATTTYTVTATTAAGCTASTTVTVTTNPNPVITIGSIQDTVCISDPLIPLVASPVGGTWSGTGVSGSNFIPPSTAVGAYTLTYSYTNAFGCAATATKKIVVKDCPERIILLRDNALTLYPNPNNGKFNIRINSVLYNNLGMRVYTNSGTLVTTQQFGGLAWGRIVPIDLSNLPGGLYMVKFTYEGGVRTSEKTFKVIIGTE